MEQENEIIENIDPKKLDFDDKETEAQSNNSYIKEKKVSTNDSADKLEKNVQLVLNEENMQIIKSMLNGMNEKLSNSRLEENYLYKDTIVCSLMENLHNLIGETEKIKSQMPKSKPPVYGKKNYSNNTYSHIGSKNGYNGELEAQSSNFSQGSKRSYSSKNSLNKSKQVFKKPIVEDIVPTKYQIMSPKVCINIVKKKKETAKVELDLNADKKLKTNNSQKKLDSLITENKKPNTKKTNLSSPNPKFNMTTTDNKTSLSNYTANIQNKGGPKFNISLKTPSKNVKFMEEPILEDSLRMGSVYKFEPKKKNIDPEFEMEHKLNESLGGPVKSNTRNSSNNINTTGTGLDGNSVIINKTLKKESNKENYKFKSNYQSKKIKDFFNNSKNIKIFSHFFSFLKLKDKKKIRVISKVTQEAFLKNEISKIESQIKLKKESISTTNPFLSINMGTEFIKKASKCILVLSDYKKETAHFISFVDCLYIFYFLYDLVEEDLNQSLKDKIHKLESNMVNKNCYFLFEAVIENIRKDRKGYDIVKGLLLNNKFSMQCCSDLPTHSNHHSSHSNNANTPTSVSVLTPEFKFYIELFKSCKRTLDEDIKMVSLVEVEILSSKLDNLKSKFK